MHERSRRIISWIPVAFSAITLILVIVDFFLGQNVRSIQLEVNQRQQYINQSLQLNRVYEALARTLAQAAVKDKDDRLRDLLAQNGITISSGGTGASPVTPPSPPTSAPATVPAPTPAPSSKEK